jgi:hypothetical protein
VAQYNLAFRLLAAYGEILRNAIHPVSSPAFACDDFFLLVSFSIPLPNNHMRLLFIRTPNLRCSSLDIWYMVMCLRVSRSLFNTDITRATRRWDHQGPLGPTIQHTTAAIYDTAYVAHGFILVSECLSGIISTSSKAVNYIKGSKPNLSH